MNHDTNVHLVVLPVFKVEEIAHVLRERQRKAWDDSRRWANCRSGAEWLEGLIKNLRRIEVVELRAKLVTFEQLAKACAEEGEGELAVEVLRQLDCPVEPQRVFSNGVAS